MDDIIKYISINMPNDAVLTLYRNAETLGLIESLQSLTQPEKKINIDQPVLSMKSFYDNTYQFDTTNRQEKYVISGDLAPAFYSNIVYKISSGQLFQKISLKFGENNQYIQFSYGKVLDGFGNQISNFNLFGGFGAKIGMNLGYRNGKFYIQKVSNPDAESPTYHEINIFDITLSQIYFDCSVSSSVNGDFIIYGSYEDLIPNDFKQYFIN